MAMGVEVASLYAKLGADVGEFNRKMSSSESRISSLGKRLGGVAAGVGKMGLIAAGGIAAAGAAVGGIGLKLASLGSDVEEMQSKFDVVFAGISDSVAASVDQIAQQTQRNKFELRGFAASFGDTLKPMGFTTQQAAEMSQQLTKLAIDLSSFNNIPLDEAFQRIQSGLVGNHENFLKFGVIINETTLKEELARMGAEGLTGALLEQAKAQARINLLMRGTTDAQGDAIRTADSWENTMRSLKSTLRETAQTMGIELLPLMTPLLADFRDMVKTVAPTAIERFRQVIGFLASPGLANTVSGLVTGLKGLGSQLLRVAGPMRDAFGGLFSRLSIAAKSGGAGGFLAQMGDELANVGKSLIGWLATTALPAVIGKLGELGQAFLLWASQLWTDSLWPGIQSTWSAFMAWITDPARKTELLTLLSSAWTAFTEWAGDTWAGIRSGLGAMWRNFKSWITDPARKTELLTFLSTTWTAFTEWAGGIWDNVSGKLGNMWTSLIDWVKNPDTWRRMGGWVKLKWTAFTSWAGEAWSRMKPKLVDMYDNLIAWINEQKPGLGTEIDGWVTILAGIPSKVKALWDSDWGTLNSGLRQTVDEIIAELDRIWSKLKELFGFDGKGGAAAGIIDGLEKFAEAAFDALRASAMAFLLSFEAVLGTLNVIKKAIMGEYKDVGEAVKDLGDVWSRWATTNFENLKDIFQSGRGPDNATPSNVQPQSFGGGRTAATININVRGDGAQLPGDRQKLRELARAIWREAELTGMRLT